MRFWRQHLLANGPGAGTAVEQGPQRCGPFHNRSRWTGRPGPAMPPGQSGTPSEYFSCSLTGATGAFARRRIQRLIISTNTEKAIAA